MGLNSCVVAWWIYAIVLKFIDFPIESEYWVQSTRIEFRDG